MTGTTTGHPDKALAGRLITTVGSPAAALTLTLVLVGATSDQAWALTAILVSVLVVVPVTARTLLTRAGRITTGLNVTARHERTPLLAVITGCLVIAGTALVVGDPTPETVTTLVVVVAAFTTAVVATTAARVKVSFHVGIATVCTILLAVLVWPWAGLLGAVWVPVLAAGRVWSGEHTPREVTMAAVIGAAAGAITFPVLTVVS